MPKTDSYSLWTDSNLTVEYDGEEIIDAYTDASEGDYDFSVYIGSPLESPNIRYLKSTSNPGVDYITLTPTDNLENWVGEQAYIVGDCVQPSSGNENGKRYKCTVAGTSDITANEPVWVTTGIGTTFTDGTVTWQFMGAKHEITEVKLALSEVGLDTAVGGDPLNIATSIDNGIANALQVFVRVTNNVLNISDNSTSPEITIDFNPITEFGE